MIKFFRKIRQGLLTENKFSKYLIYAIGEIVLVMIGILLALQVNNWNENRKNRQSETKALIDLKEEFHRIHEDLVRVYSAKKIAEGELRQYLDTLNNKSISVSEKATLNRPDLASYTWNTTNSTLTSLLNSGKIENFKNDSLKGLLTSWSDYVDDYKQEELAYNNITVQNLRMYETKFIPGEILHGEHSLKSFKKMRLPMFDADKSREAIVSNIEYHNLLITSVNHLFIQVMVSERTLKVSNKIQSLIEKELNK